MLTRLRRVRREESGFTLIELLIVIVILGILAAIVVFAVNGIQNRGTASACKADVETVTVAAEAFDAQNGHYAKNMDELVARGFLHSIPSSDSYKVVYLPDNESKSPSVSVSSDYCPAPLTAEQIQAAYCSELGTALQTFQGLRFSAIDVDEFQRAVTLFENVDAAATDAIRPDWDVLVATVKKMQQIVADTGLSRADLVTLSNNQLPDGFTQDQLNQLNQDLYQPFSTGEFQNALSQIGQDARSSCNVNIGF